MLVFGVRHVGYPGSTPMVQQDALDGAGIAGFKEDSCVIHPHEPHEAKRQYRECIVCDIHES